MYLSIWWLIIIARTYCVEKKIFNQILWAIISVQMITLWSNILKHDCIFLILQVCVEVMMPINLTMPCLKTELLWVWLITLLLTNLPHLGGKIYIWQDLYLINQSNFEFLFWINNCHIQFNKQRFNFVVVILEFRFQDKMKYQFGYVINLIMKEFILFWLEIPF